MFAVTESLLEQQKLRRGKIIVLKALVRLLQFLNICLNWKIRGTFGLNDKHFVDKIFAKNKMNRLALVKTARKTIFISTWTLYC